MISRLWLKFLNRHDHALKLQTPRYVFTGYDKAQQERAIKKSRQIHKAQFSPKAKPAKKTADVISLEVERRKQGA